MLDTVFLDAGGVLVFPNWVRIANALGERGVDVAPAALAAAEPTPRSRLIPARLFRRPTIPSAAGRDFNRC